MKKIIALILAMAMALALVACGGDNSTNSDAQDGNTPAANGTTVYVLGPTPDHGWTAQAGAYAQAKCDVSPLPVSTRLSTCPHLPVRSRWTRSTPSSPTAMPLSLL